MRKMGCPPKPRLATISAITKRECSGIRFRLLLTSDEGIIAGQYTASEVGECACLGTLGIIMYRDRRFFVLRRKPERPCPTCRDAQVGY